MSHPILPSGLAEVFHGPFGAWRATIAFVLVLTVLRVALLFASPLELYPDEAQYWVWSRRLAFGYFSKPPMIAWLIHASTAIGGNGEAWVRLTAPLMHAIAAIGLAGAGRKLYGGWTGFWAALIYSAMPGVQLSSAVIATDAPLLAFLALALWAYAALWTSQTKSAARWAALGFGAALGLAFLAKYAALYLVVGMAIHATMSVRGRKVWSPLTLGLCIGAGLLVAAPNILWNASHHFQTLAHTAANADIGGQEDAGASRFFGPRGPFGFILGQFGVFGPVLFAGLVWAGAAAVRSPVPEDRLLVWLGLPALAVVFAESVAARANANWAVAAYVPGALLAAGVLVRRRAWTLLGWGLGSQGLAALIFVVAILAPALTDAAGAANAFKRARGWRQTTDAVVNAAGAANASIAGKSDGSLSAIGVDDRFVFNALAYYGRDATGRAAGRLPGPLRMWVRLSHPANQAESEAPLDVAHGAHVFIASVDGVHRPALIADFTRVTTVGAQVIKLDPKHQRDVVFLIGTDFRPQPRRVGSAPNAPATRP